MNLLPVGQCHQSVAGLCQANVTKKKKTNKKKNNMLRCRWAALSTYHRLSKFSGGNPVKVSYHQFHRYFTNSNFCELMPFASRLHQI